MWWEAARERPECLCSVIITDGQVIRIGTRSAVASGMIIVRQQTRRTKDGATSPHGSTREGFAWHSGLSRPLLPNPIFSHIQFHPALHPSASRRPVLADERQSFPGPLFIYTCVDVEQVILPVPNGEVAGSRLRPLQFICEFDAPGRRHYGVAGPMQQPQRWQGMALL